MCFFLWEFNEGVFPLSLDESLTIVSQAVSEVKFPSAVFKFDSPERFGKKVGRLFLRWNELHFDSVIFYLLTSKVVINLKVFGFFMKNWIVTEFDVALVVAKKMGRLVV